MHSQVPPCMADIKSLAFSCMATQSSVRTWCWQRTQNSESLGNATGVSPRTQTLRPCIMQSPPGAARAGGAGKRMCCGTRPGWWPSRCCPTLLNRPGFTRGYARRWCWRRMCWGERARW